MKLEDALSWRDSSLYSIGNKIPVKIGKLEYIW